MLTITGEIPAAQIRDAQRELLALGRDGDGQLEPQEIAPPQVTALARGIMAAVDRNRDDRGERALDPRFDDLPFAVEVDGDGIVTLDDLVNKILYWADLNRDGFI